MRTNEQRADERAAIAAAVARVLGWSEEDVILADNRARREALDGFRNGYDFGGWLSMGEAPDGTASLKLYTYTGRTVDPRATGIAGASTLD